MNDDGEMVMCGRVILLLMVTLGMGVREYAE